MWKIASGIGVSLFKRADFGADDVDTRPATDVFDYLFRSLVTDIVRVDLDGR